MNNNRSHKTQHSGRLLRSGVGKKDGRSFPRLIVDDAVAATKIMIAKTRAEVAGLETALRAISGSEPAAAK